MTALSKLLSFAIAEEAAGLKRDLQNYPRWAR